MRTNQGRKHNTFLKNIFNGSSQKKKILNFVKKKHQYQPIFSIFESKITMRPIIYILLLSLGFVSCNTPVPDTTKNQHQSNPPIKKCKIYSSDFVALNPDDKGQLIQVFAFNRQGFVNELVRYDIEGKVIEKFDIKGNNTLFPIPNTLQFIDTLVTTFDMDSLGELHQKEVKQYNSNGLLVELSYFDGQNKILKRNTYQYDSLNLITKDIYWDIELNIPRQVIRYEYEFFSE
jgi:hypothetical protein